VSETQSPGTPRRRAGRIERATKESSVLVEIDLDGTGAVDVETGIGFYDHMLAQLGKHGLFDLTSRPPATCTWIRTTRSRTPPSRSARPSARRSATRPASAASRTAGCRSTRPPHTPWWTCPAAVPGAPRTRADRPMIGSYDTTLTRHIFESFVAQAQICLHVDVPYGRNAHHIVEAQFKAVARALRDACALDPRVVGVPSTKGVL